MQTARPRHLLTTVNWVVLALAAAGILFFTAWQTRLNWRDGPLHPAAASHSMPEEDFANLWAAGRLVRAGRLPDLYSAAGFQHWKETLFGAPLQDEAWVYPPTVLLLGVPLSLLPLLWGFLLWNAASVLLAVWLLRAARLPWPVIAFGLGGPATWRSLVLGQYGLVTGALVVAGLLLSPRLPVRAGLMLGFATLKPQQGLIAPIAWAAARNFRAIGAAAALTAALAGAVAVAFGPAAWQLAFTDTGALARQLLDAPPPRNYISDGVCVFWMLRTAGASLSVAYAGQIIAALAAAGIAYHAWRRPDADPNARMALTVCLSLLITPYGFTSDMVAVSIAIGVLLAAKNWRISLLDGVLWLWPAYCPLVTLKTGLLLTPLVTTLVAARAWRLMTGTRHRMSFE